MKKQTIFWAFFIMIGFYQSCTYKKNEYVVPKSEVITDTTKDIIDTTKHPSDTTKNPSDTSKIPTPKPTPTVTPTPTATVFFTKDIVPIFNSCKSCHSSSNETLNLSTNVYTNLTKEINKTTPKSSKLYLYLNKGHNGGTAAQATKVLTWITEGAKNN